MQFRRVAALAISLAGMSAAPPVHATETTIEQMPAGLETRLALSAAPRALRYRATVYILDPGKGYLLARQGTGGVTCVVGTKTYLQATPSRAI